LVEVDTSVNRIEEIEAQATQWLVRLDAARSPEVMAEHARWMAESARHQVAYARLTLAWKKMDALRRMRPLDPPGEADPDLLKPRKKWWPGTGLGVGAFRRSERGDSMNRSPFFTWARRLTIGVAIAPVFGVGAFLVLQPKSELAFMTRVGGQQHVTLDDGSVVDLNTNTRVRVQYTAARRLILLDRGEVMLSVAHDASRPLEVVAAGVMARAVGTKFSVRLHEDGRVETLVTEGRVLILRQDTVMGIRMEPQPIGHTLVAGERVVVDARTAMINSVTAQEMEQMLMWTTGRISFQRAKLSTVVREINRYNSRQLEILDPRIAETWMGGGFYTEHADAYAEDLTSFFGETALRSVESAPAD
jgi:transmembrane sensor